MPARVEAVEHQQPAAGGGHHAVSMPRLMGPLGSPGIRLVDEQDLGEVDHGVVERDAALDASHVDV